MDNTESTSQVSAIPFGSKPLQVLRSGLLRCCGEVEPHPLYTVRRLVSRHHGGRLSRSLVVAESAAHGLCREDEAALSVAL